MHPQRTGDPSRGYQTIAARIPQELFQAVLHYVGGDAFVGVPSRAPDTFHLSSCSLVCRYWSRMVREKLFTRVLLRSAKDVERLDKLLDYPSAPSMTPISSLVKHVFIELDGHGAWLHRVPQLITSKLTQRAVRVYLNVHHMRRGDERYGTLSTLHFGLPRRLPYCFSPITVLFLGKKHFRDGAELIRLLSAIPSLEEIFFEDLKWNTFPDKDTFYHRSLGQNVYGVDTVTMNDFPAMWLLPALISRQCRPHLPRSRLQVQTSLLNLRDYHILEGAFANMKGRSTLRGPPANQQGHPLIESPNCNMVRIAFNKPAAQGKLVHDFTIWFGQLGTPNELHVARIDVGCPTEDFHVAIVRRAWQTFSDHLAQLPYLDCVRFIFKDGASALRFRAEYATEFRKLGEAGKVAFGWTESIRGRRVYLFYRYEYVQN